MKEARSILMAFWVPDLKHEGSPIPGVMTWWDVGALSNDQIYVLLYSREYLSNRDNEYRVIEDINLLPALVQPGVYQITWEDYGLEYVDQGVLNNTDTERYIQLHGNAKAPGWDPRWEDFEASELGPFPSFTVYDDVGPEGLYDPFSSESKIVELHRWTIAASIAAQDLNL